MKFRRLLFPIIGFLVLITSSAKPIANANNINHLKNEGNNIVLRMANSLDNLDDTEDPNEIFFKSFKRIYRGIRFLFGYNWAQRI